MKINKINFFILLFILSFHVIALEFGQNRIKEKEFYYNKAVKYIKNKYITEKELEQSNIYFEIKGEKEILHDLEKVSVGIRINSYTETFRKSFNFKFTIDGDLVFFHFSNDAEKTTIYKIESDKKPGYIEIIKNSRKYMQEYLPENINQQDIKIINWIFDLHFMTSGKDELKSHFIDYVYKKDNLYYPIYFRMEIHIDGSFSTFVHRKKTNFDLLKEKLNYQINITKDEAEKIGFEKFIEFIKANKDEYVIIKDFYKEDIINEKKDNLFANSSIPRFYKGEPIIEYPNFEYNSVYIKKLEDMGYKFIDKEKEKILIKWYEEYFPFELRPVYPVMIRRKDYRAIKYNYLNVAIVFVDAETGEVIGGR
ncbi:MAG: hypothetical protein WC337_08710 [Candidatus Muiribacteriota bacterium]